MLILTLRFTICRAAGERFGFAASVEKSRVTSQVAETSEVNMEDVENETQEMLEKAAMESESDSELSDQLYPFKCNLISTLPN